MFLKSKERKCSTCKWMFISEYNHCNHNRDKSCTGGGTYKNWVDIYELCNGCRKRLTQDTNPECKDCQQIKLLATKNRYEAL